jgi:hypothetical protein
VKTAELELRRTGKLPSAYDLRNRLKGVSSRISLPGDDDRGRLGAQADHRARISPLLDDWRA